MRDRKRGVKLAKMFQEVLDVDEDLAKIDDLEQARHNIEQMLVEAKDHAGKAVGNLKKVREELAVAEDDLKLAKKEAEDTISLAKQAAQEIITKAKTEANAIVEGALGTERMVADRIVVDQERHAEHLRDYALAQDKAQTEVEAIENKLTELREQIGLK